MEIVSDTPLDYLVHLRGSEKKKMRGSKFYSARKNLEIYWNGKSVVSGLE